MGGDGATAPFAGYSSTAGDGTQTWYAVSALNLPGPSVLRILPPSAPAAGRAHSFLFALPVSTGTDATFGDPVTVIGVDLAAPDAYNTTLVVPSFPIQPWYADNPDNAGQQQESFMLALAAWLPSSQFASGGEEINLISFSKGGNAVQFLLFKHPLVFAHGASWDCPTEMTDVDTGTDTGVDAVFGPVSGNPAESFGTSANFTGNYALTDAHLTAWDTAAGGVFVLQKRLWVGGWFSFEGDVDAYRARLTGLGIQFDGGWDTGDVSHAWHDDWVASALASIMTSAPPSLLLVNGIV